MKPKIRQPIVTVCGHVDHGKTSILDCIRNSCFQQDESGGITQKISFTSYPMTTLKQACPLIDASGIKLNIPGFLFIDTPGHAAFTNLRKRGGSLADLAILVIDINEGIKPQTAEVIEILKLNKTPFLIALNKIDNISGWRKMNDSVEKSISLQNQNIKQIFDERYLTLIGSLNAHGFDADLFFKIDDFSKKIALVPCSAKTKEGIPELIMMLCGLSQKYLQNKLELGKNAKGVILEVKKEKSIKYAQAILYDGELKKTDEIAVASFEGNPLITKIRTLEEIEPLSMRFKQQEKVTASTGLRMQLIEKQKIMSGMPFIIYTGDKEKIKESFKKEISGIIKTNKEGIIVKADSLGSLEALLLLLKQSNISVLKAGIGEINKNDLISARANLEINELNAIIIGFNVKFDEEAKEMQKGKVKIFTDDVVYKLIENLTEFRKQKRLEIEKARLMQLTTIAKLKVLSQYVFRNTKPAIFGVKVEAGKLISGLNMINEKGEKVGRIKNIQSQNSSVTEAKEEMEVAISVPGLNFEREMKNINNLYSDISSTQFKNFKKNKDLLSQKEIKTIQEIAQIKRQKDPEWGN